ncbi:MAG: TetR/AcrR family transcriptional regulator [Solobacterium sp.]|nr:TetR/AcrR family transcriptional regulator [Solobacterium sp.]
MPPKPKITREMIIDAAVEVIRKQGFENINARALAEHLQCSTQPVMYHFSTMEELKQAAYDKVDHLHTEYLLRVSDETDPMLGIGLNYIRFAVEEPNLFRFLFQSGYVKEKNLFEMVEAEEVMPILQVLQGELEMDIHKTKEIFLIVAMFVHGYASIIANNHLAFDEKTAAYYLKQSFIGAVAAYKQEENR